MRRGEEQTEKLDLSGCTPSSSFDSGTMKILCVGSGYIDQADLEFLSSSNAPASGTRAGGVALIGDGREFKLGLRGALPLGAWLKTTTHCPTRQAG